MKTSQPPRSNEKGRRAKRARYQRPARAGVSLIELVIASLLVASVAGLLLPTVGWIAAERRAALERQAAAEELANLMDHLTGRPWDEITGQRAEQLGLAAVIERQLPEAQLAVSVDPDQNAKRIHLSLSWSNRAGRTVGPVRLTTWVYPRSVPKSIPTPAAEDGQAPQGDRP